MKKRARNFIRPCNARIIFWKSFSYLRNPYRTTRSENNTFSDVYFTKNIKTKTDDKTI